MVSRHSRLSACHKPTIVLHKESLVPIMAVAVVFLVKEVEKGILLPKVDSPFGSQRLFAAYCITTVVLMYRIIYQANYWSTS